MSHGKSLRLLAGGALLAAVAYAAFVHFERRPHDASALDPALERELAEGFYGEGKLTQAFDLLSRIAARPDATAQDLANLACIYFQQAEDPGAVPADRKEDEAKFRTEVIARTRELCQQALAKDERCAAAWFMLGALAFDDERDYATARDAFTKAIASAPQDTQVYLRLSDALKELDDLDGAVRNLEIVVQRGLAYGGVYYRPALYKLMQHLRRRRKGDDLKRSDQLLAEFKELQALATANGKEEEKIPEPVLKIGDLGKVKVTRASAHPAVPSSPVRPTFEVVQPGLLAAAGRVHDLARADLDGDRRPDLLVAGEEGLFAAIQDEKGVFSEKRLLAGATRRVLAVEFASDKDMREREPVRALHVVALQAEGLKLLEPTTDGGWQDITPRIPPLPEVRDLLAVDYDHDGWVDLLVATAQGPRLLQNHGVEINQETNEKVGPIQLADLSTTAGLPTTPCSWVAIEDFDADQDIDLLAGGPGMATTLFSNLRKGTFEALAPEKTGLPAELARAPRLADLDRDALPDLLILEGTVGWQRGKGNGTFDAIRPLAPLAGLAGRPSTLGDFDLNGELDLYAEGDGKPATTAYGPLVDAAIPVAVEASSAPNPAPATGVAPLAADLDQDGDFDLCVAADRGVELRRATLSGSANAFLLLLRGRKDNWQGYGAIVEVLTGTHYQRRLWRGADELFGLGAAKSPDVVRITWPGGVPQWPLQAGPAPTPTTPPEDLEVDRNKYSPPAPRILGSAGSGAATRRGTAMDLMQKPGPISSCPFLYSWNGKSYVFVSDVLGATPLGLPMTESIYVPPNHDELVRVTSEQLAPIDGEYRFQFTEELREVTYLDRAELWVVDHPADVEVHPEERFCFPPFPPKKVHTVRGALPLVRAVDQAGHDWTDALAREDGVHAVPFDLLDPRYAGVATRHSLVLTLPAAAKDAALVRLLMTGWLMWGDASVNVALDRNGTVEFLPPVLSVPDGHGGWRDCGPPVGFPAGKTKTMVLDVTPFLQRDDLRLKLTSTLQLYWDAIRVAVDGNDAPITITKVEPKRVNLWYRGFSAPEPQVWGARDLQPDRFDWGRLEPVARWDQHQGMLTRYGDVLPLLRETDDQFVILSAGDAIDLRFAATSFAPPASGEARTFLLFVDGWAKDGDANTRYSQSVEPLPFHGMTGYPYGADEHYPDDDLHRRYRAEWNTRRGRRLVPSLVSETGEPTH